MRRMNRRALLTFMGLFLIGGQDTQATQIMDAVRQGTDHLNRLQDLADRVTNQNIGEIQDEIQRGVQEGDIPESRGKGHKYGHRNREDSPGKGRKWGHRKAEWHPKWGHPKGSRKHEKKHKKIRPGNLSTNL